MIFAVPKSETHIYFFQAQIIHNKVAFIRADGTLARFVGSSGVFYNYVCPGTEKRTVILTKAKTNTWHVDDPHGQVLNCRRKP